MPEESRDRLTVHRPDAEAEAIFVHPGGWLFEALRGCVNARFADDALRGAVFVDPAANRPYLFHLALLAIERKADPALRDLARTEALEYHLIGLRQEEDGAIETCPTGQLLLLKGGQGLAPSALNLVASAREAVEAARRRVNEHLAPELIENAVKLCSTACRRASTSSNAGSAIRKRSWPPPVQSCATRPTPAARARKSELTKVKERQSRLASRREEAIAVLRREPELVSASEVVFLAHALVVPSQDPADRLRHDAQVEAVAVRFARAYEEALGAIVRDVSTPSAALAAGLEERPGFDLLSTRPGAESLCIEVKGRADVGDIELTENEWVKACNLRERYWLYVVYDCASAQPRLLRVQDPFERLIVRAKSSIVINAKDLFEASTGGE